METKAELDSPKEKNYFLNRQDMALELICMSVSPQLQYRVEDSSLVCFNLVQLLSVNIFSVKEQKIYNDKYTHYTNIFPRENQHILYSSTLQDTRYIKYVEHK
jgi:hypothetical protein